VLCVYVTDIKGPTFPGVPLKILILKIFSVGNAYATNVVASSGGAVGETWDEGNGGGSRRVQIRCGPSLNHTDIRTRDVMKVSNVLGDSGSMAFFPALGGRMP